MRGLRGWRRLRGGLPSILMAGLLGCASPGAVSKMDPALLPVFPTYEVMPKREPCQIEHQTRRCLLVLEDDEMAMILYLKQLCYILTGDRMYCRMDEEA